MANISEAMVEAGARKLCRLDGYDPDGKNFGHKVRTWEAYAKTAEACLEAAISTAPASAQMEGMVLVPREPTRDMTMAACDVLPSVEGVFGRAGALSANVYRAMITAYERAAPLPTSEADNG